MSNTTVLYCIALGLAAVGVTWWVYGGGLLLLVLALFAAVCPLLAIWVMRQSRSEARRDDRREEVR